MFICESNKDLRRSYYDKLYDIRNIAQKAANAATSHLFMLDNKIPYLDEASREAIRFVGTKGTPASRQNAAYCLMSNLFKESMPGIMDMLSNLAQYVTKNYNEDRKKGIYKRSLRSYRDTLPIPYQRKSFRDLRFAEYENGEGKKSEGCFFSLAGIPFQMRFGRDRSGNRLIVERVINGEYKMCTSSIQINGNKCFLLLCVDIPKKEVKLDEDKTLFAFLGVLNPIICTCDVRAANDYRNGDGHTSLTGGDSHSGSEMNNYRVWQIGTKEEFHYRRRQIQEAVRRCQINNRYSIGGKGRKKKCKAIDRYHDKEKNYVDTKLHTYSKMLVDLAIKHRCGKIVLMRETHREEDAKQQNQEGDALVLRNWSYYGLKEKIEYKCKMHGIKIKEEK